MFKYFDLQLFADDSTPTPGNGADGGTDPKPAGGGDDGNKGGTDPKPDPADEKKYSDADVDRIMKDRRARWEKEKKAAEDEAAKLAKMDEQQKLQYEFEKQQKANEDLQAEIDQLRQEKNRIELTKAAATLLQNSNIDATEGILNFVVGKDAETTKANIDAFVKTVEAQVKKAEVARATGSTPKVITHTGNAMSEIEKRLAKYN